ncbi:hypothetical protein [Paenibacillus sp. GCM10027626]|uniref:hypothetical protein n=1 Tax=Paenibacillus sp. GCM10027626 TaxID=3273411 RepID=UPI00362EEF66
MSDMERERNGLEEQRQVCFQCGESLGLPKGEGHTSSSTILCSDCEAASEKPISHHYLNEYYYRFAD